MIGDSVVYGSAQIDQSQLATEILENKLKKDLQRPIVAGNIAAGSWGPPNQLAYLKRYRLFDADAVVLVLSSHDYKDVPTFTPIVDIDADYPGYKPVLVLQEGVTRYLPCSLGIAKSTDEAIGNSNKNPDNPRISMGALREIVELSRKSGAKFIFAQHLEKREIEGEIQPGHQVIIQIARGLKIPVVQLGEDFKKSLQSGKDPYIDVIHPNVLGQSLIADTLEAALLKQI